MSARIRRNKRQRGASLAELAVILPVILVVLLGIIDVGRIFYVHQVLNDLSREAANLVSRGSTVDAAFAAAAFDEGPVSVADNGAMIVSTIRRRSTDDATPWIVDQQRRGAVTSAASRVGASGQAAKIPNVTTLEPGVTLVAVELMHGFAPLFSVKRLGLEIYPETVYEAAFF
jgi:Flp pilus assembly protein TadG